MGSKRLKRGPATPILVAHSPVQRNCEFELRKEVSKLKETIQTLTHNLEQKSAQNEEIIQHYYKQYKELEQSRQELKLLQHEYTQMTSVYRITRMELESKLQDANERINQLLEDRDKKTTKRYAKRPLKKATAAEANFPPENVSSSSDEKPAETDAGPAEIDEKTEAKTGPGRLSPATEIDEKETGLSPAMENDTETGEKAEPRHLSPAKENVPEVRRVKKSDAPKAKKKAGAFQQDCSPVREGQENAVDVPPVKKDAKKKARAATTGTCFPDDEENVAEGEIQETGLRERPKSTSGRPRRARAVSSYKEPPLNTKMRRA